MQKNQEIKDFEIKILKEKQAEFQELEKLVKGKEQAAEKVFRDKEAKALQQKTLVEGKLRMEKDEMLMKLEAQMRQENEDAILKLKVELIEKDRLLKKVAGQKGGPITRSLMEEISPGSTFGMEVDLDVQIRGLPTIREEESPTKHIKPPTPPEKKHFPLGRDDSLSGGAIVISDTSAKKPKLWSESKTNIQNPNYGVRAKPVAHISEKYLEKARDKPMMQGQQVIGKNPSLNKTLPDHRKQKYDKSNLKHPKAYDNGEVVLPSGGFKNQNYIDNASDSN